MTAASHPDFWRWEARVRRIGGCEHPVYLSGRAATVDAVSGEVLRVLDAGDQPRGRLMIACGNRRASRCEPCSRTYQGDTFHLIRAGLTGGKGVPATVAEHPRVFVTLTAPSFGPVHAHIEQDGTIRSCRPRRDRPVCGHGRRTWCRARHPADDPAIGQPLCPACFDYPGAVLWNAHASRLWHRFTDTLRRRTLPRLVALSVKEFSHAVRVSFAKVAEYQRRGLVHFHAVIRLDGPGPDQHPPPWATLDLLDTAVQQAAATAHIPAPDGPAGQRTLRWGDQLDVRALPGLDGDESLSDEAVAGYIAKYATKAAECVGTVDRPLTCRSCRGTGLAGACPTCNGSGLARPLDELSLPPHARALVGTAWQLGGLPEYRSLRLRAWAHQCGYGGHFTTKSRTYSTTLGALRRARAQHRAHQAGGTPGDQDGAVTLGQWHYAGSGYTPGEALLARGIRTDITVNRETAREELAALTDQDDWWTNTDE